MTDKIITFLSIRQKITCPVCNGTGELVTEDCNVTEYADAYVFVCNKCDGKGYKMRKRSMSLEQFKKLKN